MSITKANILIEVQDRTARGSSLTTIDTELEAVMREVSALVPGLCQKNDTVTLGADIRAVSLPPDCLRPYSVSDASGNSIGSKVDFENYISRVSADTTSGTMRIWTEHAKSLYVWRPPATEQVLTVYFDYEDSDVDAITMPDPAEEALIEGTCYAVWAGLGAGVEVPPEAQTHKTEYEKHIAVLQARYAYRSV